jgi:branched-chain amino acid transport system permease protein
MEIFLQQLINGLTTGTLFALVAIGYTMVYGIIELINFAHGDLFMLGAFLALTLATRMHLARRRAPGWVLAVSVPVYFVGSGMPPPSSRERGNARSLRRLAGAPSLQLHPARDLPVLAPAQGDGPSGGVILIFLLCMWFSAALNFLQDRIIYRPLRNAPKLTPLVSAIGVSFVFQGIGQIWKGVADINFPDILPNRNLLGIEALRFTEKDLLVILVTVPLMAGLTIFVRFTKLGKAMRATAQNPVAARLMGIDVDRVIGWTFAIGGLLAGAASVIYGLTINTVSFQMGYQNGLYAFTAAVLGGIGNLPGAMLGGIVIGLVRSLGSQYVGEQWTSALVFAILILLLVFRPSGLLGARTREKV